MVERMRRGAWSECTFRYGCASRLAFRTALPVGRSDPAPVGDVEFVADMSQVIRCRSHG